MARIREVDGEREMVAFAGPLGSSDHRVVPLFGIEEFDPLPMPSIEEVIVAVSTTPGLLGVLPVENSTEGEFSLTLDRLIFDAEGAYIVGEAVLAEAIWGFGVEGGAVPHTAISHASILDLCADFIRHRGLLVRHAVSTKAACDEVARTGDPGLLALAPPTVGVSVGLVPRWREVARVDELRTRYALIAHRVADPTGCDRSMLAIVPRFDAAGALSEVADLFREHRVNMTAILSRPISAQPTSHCFVISAEGHVAVDPLRGLVRALLVAGHRVKLLGSYPRWSGVEVVTPSADVPRGELLFDALG